MCGRRKSAKPIAQWLAKNVAMVGLESAAPTPAPARLRSAETLARHSPETSRWLADEA